MTQEEVMEQVKHQVFHILNENTDENYRFKRGVTMVEVTEQILSIPEILIKDPDQTLDSFLKIVGKHYPEFLDVIIKENWVKVLKE